MCSRRVPCCGTEQKNIPYTYHTWRDTRSAPRRERGETSVEVSDLTANRGMIQNRLHACVVGGSFEKGSHQSDRKRSAAGRAAAHSSGPSLLPARLYARAPISVPSLCVSRPPSRWRRPGWFARLQYLLTVGLRSIVPSPRAPALEIAVRFAPRRRGHWWQPRSTRSDTAL